MTNKFNFFCWAFIFTILSVVYSLIAKNTLPNSDVISSFREARDILNGNILLSGWKLSTVSFYFTEIIPYALAIKIIGFNEHLYYIVPGIFMGVLVTISLYVSNHNRNLSFYAVLATFAMPTSFSSSIMLIACIHIGAYILILLCLVLLEQYRLKGSLKLLLTYMIMLSTLSFSDDIAKYAFIIPVILVCLYRVALGIYKQENINYRYVVLIASTAVSIAVSKCISFFFLHFGGFTLPGITTPHFVDFSQLTNNISLTIQGTFHFFGGYVFGMEIGDKRTFFSLIKVIFIFSFIYLSTRCILKFKDLDFFCQVLVASSLLMFFAYLLSDRPTNLFSIRYIVPTFVFMSIVISRSAFAFSAKRNIAISLIVILLSIPSLATLRNTVNTNDVTIELRNFLHESGYNRGYASFWFASSVAGFSDINVAPYELRNNQFVQYNGLSKSEWYKAGAEFLIADDEDQIGNAIRQFGTPSEKHKIQDKIVLIWKDGIRALN